jgi:hypothetical protein
VDVHRRGQHSGSPAVDPLWGSPWGFPRLGFRECSPTWGSHVGFTRLGFHVCGPFGGSPVGGSRGGPLRVVLHGVQRGGLTVWSPPCWVPCMWLPVWFQRGGPLWGVPWEVPCRWSHGVPCGCSPVRCLLEVATWFESLFGVPWNIGVSIGYNIGRNRAVYIARNIGR